DTGDLGDIFEQMFGGRAGSQRQRSTAGGPFGAQARPQKGQDIEHTITVPFEKATSGGTVSLRLAGGPAGTQTVDVRIPKGVAEGAKLRLRGKGAPSSTGGEPGDLILTVKVAAHPYFKRQGLDLYVDVPVSIDEAVFGTTIDVPTLAGKVGLKIPPGTGSGRKLRLRGRGIENTKGDTGDLYAVVQVDVPKELTDDQRELLEQIKDKLPNPRKHLPWHT
ncbi:MAG: DnaJ C-terminal domain-containing protein, partial [Phycisphaeraceae bacterium]